MLLRRLLRAAGVHVYVDSDDVLLTDGRFLSLTATSAGDKEMALPGGRSLLRLGTSQHLSAQQGVVRETYDLGETRYYLIEQPRQSTR